MQPQSAMRFGSDCRPTSTELREPVAARSHTQAEFEPLPVEPWFRFEELRVPWSPSVGSQVGECGDAGTTPRKVADGTSGMRRRFWSERGDSNSRPPQPHSAFRSYQAFSNSIRMWCFCPISDCFCVSYSATAMIWYLKFFSIKNSRGVVPMVPILK